MMINFSNIPFINKDGSKNYIIYPIWSFISFNQLDLRINNRIFYIGQKKDVLEIAEGLIPDTAQRLKKIFESLGVYPVIFKDILYSESDAFINKSNEALANYKINYNTMLYYGISIQRISRLFSFLQALAISFGINQNSTILEANLQIVPKQNMLPLIGNKTFEWNFISVEDFIRQIISFITNYNSSTIENKTITSSREFFDGIITDYYKILRKEINDAANLIKDIDFVQALHLYWKITSALYDFANAADLLSLLSDKKEIITISNNISNIS